MEINFLSTDAIDMMWDIIGNKTVNKNQFIQMIDAYEDLINHGLNHANHDYFKTRLDVIFKDEE